MAITFNPLTRSLDNTVEGQTNLGTNTNFGDNVKLTFGVGNDLEIHHNGTNSIISNSTGRLELQGGELRLVSSGGAENILKGFENGAVELYYDSVLKCATSSSGLDLPDNSKLQLGTSQDLKIYHDGTQSFIQKGDGTGNLYVDANGIILRGANAETLASFTENGAAELYHDNVKKLETTSSGITVTGTVTETSDIALKENIQPLNNVLDKVKQLTGYQYNFVNSEKTSMGVIAQDVEKVFPELVHGEEGEKSLQYSGLVGALIESVKELSTKVADLESKLYT